MPARLGFCGIAICVIVTAVSAQQQQQQEFFYVKNECIEPIKFYIRSSHPRSRTGWVGPAVIPPGETWGYPLDQIGYEPFEIYIYQGKTVLHFSREYLCTMMAECRQWGQKEWTRTATIGRTKRRGKGYVFRPQPGPNKLRTFATVDENTVTFVHGLRACAYCKQVDDPPPPPPPPQDK